MRQRGPGADRPRSGSPRGLPLRRGGEGPLTGGGPPNRWLAETGGTRGPAYARRFRALAEAGQDLHGEARFCAGLLPAEARVLDAGCGTGRIARELARFGHHVVGVDIDDSMLAQARLESPELTWVRGDLAEVDAPGHPFDLVVAAGNVLIYLSPGSEADVVGRLAGQLRPGGLLVAGFREEPYLDGSGYTRLCAAAGLVPMQRWSSWDRDPYPGDGYVVDVHVRPAHSP